jgi:hypothetical protein
MRALALPFLLAMTGAAAVLACSSTAEDDVETSAHDLTDEELARSALKIMGAPQVQQDPGDHGSCAFTGCHSINPITLKQWGEQFKAATDQLGNADRTNKDKINWFRQNPDDERTGFTPERIGIMSAGAHLALGANVSESRHPEAFKQGKMLSKIFEGQPELYAEFRKEMLMPVLPDFPRLTASQYETVLTWFQKGMPHLADIVRENRPTKCEDSFEGLKARTSEVKNQNWAATNYSRRLAMLGCPAPNPDQPISPTACFQQKRDNKDIFPSAADTDFARTWPQDGSTVRILRELSSPNSFWLRSSADGRFAMTGGGRNGGAQAIDLQANLDGQSRDIGLQASFDPDFWPDNKAFMFQSGLKFCAQSVLEKASTTLVSFSEPECTSLSGAPGLYQTVGQVIGDNSVSDRFILFSIWAGDSGQYTASAKDTSPRAGEDSAINIYAAVAKGNDVEEGYEINGDAFKVATPFRGDTMMGRSGKLIGSRWAYGADADGKTATGYAIEKLDYRVVNGKYRFDMTTAGNVCMKGNKANFSFDERFLTTHHYNEPSDFGAADDPKYLEKGSADIFVVDFVTGKKQKVTKMGPGQFALYPHFRSDGWLYFLVVDQNTSPAKYMVVGSDWAIRQTETTPTP